MQRTAALRREFEEIPKGEGIKHIGVPNHFEFASLDNQLGSQMDAHKESRLNPKPFEKFLAAREWPLAEFTNGGMGLVIAPHDDKIGDTYGSAARTLIERFSRIRELTVDEKVRSPKNYFARAESTTRRMALLRQWHNPDVWEDLDFHLLLVRFGPSRRDEIEINAGALMPMIWFDMSLFEGLSAFIGNPGRLDSCHDGGIDFAGDVLSGDHIPCISVQDRVLKIHTRPGNVSDHRFWNAQVAVLR